MASGGHPVGVLTQVQHQGHLTGRILGVTISYDSGQPEPRPPDSP